MLEKEQKEGWEELKEIWKNSSQTEKINFQISGLIDELKDKPSQFEKDSINKDVTKITALVKKFLNLLRKIK